MRKWSSRKWIVINGPSQEDIVFDLLNPAKDIVYRLTVREDCEDGEEFILEVEVDEIFAGVNKRYGGKRHPWTSLYSFKGTTFHPKLTFDLASRAQIEVMYSKEKDNGKLSVVELD